MSAFVFSSPTCEPCRQIKPVLQDLKDEFPSFNWINVNIKDDPAGLTQKYGVKVVPTVVVDTGKTVQSHSGTSVMGYYRILKSAMIR